MRISLLLLDIGWTVVAGAAMAVTVIPINVVVFLIWASLLVVLHRRWSVILMQCCILVLMLTAAALAPMKTAEKVLGRTVSLPATQMSLQQLNTYVNTPENRYNPIPMCFTFADEDKENIVRWPSRQMTLAEFITAIESQTPLRHRLRGCGNAWTLLWGGDCGYLLWIYDPDYSRQRHK
jgi:hypothetical protein